MPRPSRGGRPRDPSRDGVIRAAILRLLADVGYGALTMDAVASEAGVGKATIYRRWPNKEALLIDAVTAMKGPLPELAGESVRDDIDMDLMIDVFAGPAVYRLLITGGDVEKLFTPDALLDMLLNGLLPPASPRT